MVDYTRSDKDVIGLDLMNGRKIVGLFGFRCDLKGEGDLEDLVHSAGG
jgi:hypothetical protein